MFLDTWISIAGLSKENKSRSRITDDDILLMVKKATGGETCHAIHGYAQINNKYMKDYDPSI